MQKEAALFKALSDPTRLRLTVLLATQDETCVCALAKALNEPEYKVSRHLSILRSAGMVDARREGAWIYYRLAEARSGMEKCLHNYFRNRMTHVSTFHNDLKRLKKNSGRKTN